MTKYRKVQHPQDAYMVTCDHCGQESGPYPSPPAENRPHYCGHCGRICRQNDAFEQNKSLMGAKVVGFRFGHGSEVLSLVLKKGNRTYEVWAQGSDYGGEDDRVLIVNDRLRRVPSCYAFKREKVPKART